MREIRTSGSMSGDALRCMTARVSVAWQSISGDENSFPARRRGCSLYAHSSRRRLRTYRAKNGTCSIGQFV
jgi:hypothetical protein